MNEMSIRNATAADEEWIVGLFDDNAQILGGAFIGKRMFFRWASSKNKKDKIVVVSGKAFAHYRNKKDGTKTLYEIAVHSSEKRKGIGTLLMNHIGRPVVLKTDRTNEESNAFYRALGLTLCGKTKTKSGKELNIWQGW